jgi:hypothetical protein
MYNPRSSLFWMTVYLAIVAGVCLFLFAHLESAFLANWGFNTLILGVLLFGIGINLAQVAALAPEINWIKLFRTGETGISVAIEPRLLGPLARHLTGRVKDRFSLSALSLRTVLDGIRARLDEAREISRYMIGLLIFLGLLGTFWGLLDTIAAVAGVIDGLDVTAQDVDSMFEDLKAGLSGPLAGMGTAFSSSLFGLGGSLILGFLDILAGQAQNRFFNALEEWLSGLTQLVDEMPSGAAVSGLPLLDDRFDLLAREMHQTNRMLAELLRGRDADAS